jgi:hypothetical protein
MAEVLAHFEPPLRDPSGRTFKVRICGRPADELVWEGWIEFHPLDGGEVLRTPSETEQPNRKDLDYWASGITVPYLEGAFDRALPSGGGEGPRSTAETPAFDAPAQVRRDPGPAPEIRPHALLDPFSVYAQGEDVLRKELKALDEGHLRNIIRAHRLTDESAEPASGTSREGLVHWIVERVKELA